MSKDRITKIASYIYPYKKIADVGCDHGYLIIDAFEKMNIEKAVAIDNKKGPLSKAIENIKGKKYYKDVRFSLSSGIKDIDIDTECVVISGMGGKLITEIIEDDFNNLINVKRLLLVPHKDCKDVRICVLKYGFKPVFEKIIFDSGIYYTIIVCDKDNNNDKKYTDDELTFGPYLLEEKDELFIKMYEEKINNLSNILKNNLDDKTRYEIENQIKKIRSIL